MPAARIPGQASGRVTAASDRGQRRAGDLRRFLERRVDRAQHRRGHDEADRREVKALHPAHAEDAGDIERGDAEAEDLHRQRVEETDARMHQEEPAHRCGEAGNEQAERHQGQNDRLAVEIGALDQPGCRHAESQRDDKRDQSDPERVEQHAVDEGIAEDGDVMREGIGLAGIDRTAFAEAQQQHDHRRHDNDRTRGDGHHDHRPAPRRVAR